MLKSSVVEFNTGVIKVGKLIINTEWVFIIVLTAVLFCVLWFILNKTKLGLAWRATAEDAEIAKAMGVNTNVSMALSYILGYGFAAAAGIMVGMLYNSISPTMGDIPSYKCLL